MTFSIKVYSSLNEKKNIILARPSEITAPIHYMGSSLANNGILSRKIFFPTRQYNISLVVFTFSYLYIKIQIVLFGIL